MKWSVKINWQQAPTLTDFAFHHICQSGLDPTHLCLQAKWVFFSALSTKSGEHWGNLSRAMVAVVGRGKLLKSHTHNLVCRNTTEVPPNVCCKGTNYIIRIKKQHWKKRRKKNPTLPFPSSQDLQSHKLCAPICLCQTQSLKPGRQWWWALPAWCRATWPQCAALWHSSWHPKEAGKQIRLRRQWPSKNT